MDRGHPARIVNWSAGVPPASQTYARKRNRTCQTSPQQFANSLRCLAPESRRLAVHWHLPAAPLMQPSHSRTRYRGTPGPPNGQSVCQSPAKRHRRRTKLLQLRTSAIGPAGCQSPKCGDISESGNGDDEARNACCRRNESSNRIRSHVSELLALLSTNADAGR